MLPLLLLYHHITQKNTFSSDIWIVSKKTMFMDLRHEVWQECIVCLSSGLQLWWSVSERSPRSHSPHDTIRRKKLTDFEITRFSLNWALQKLYLFSNSPRPSFHMFTFYIAPTDPFCPCSYIIPLRDSPLRARACKSNEGHVQK